MSESPVWNPPSRREIGVVAALTAALLLLDFALGGFQPLEDWLLAPERRAYVDAVLLGAGVVLMGLTVLAWRWWRPLQLALQAQTQTRQLVEQSADGLILPGEPGRVSAWNSAALRDIPEHQRAEDALRESEARYRNLLEVAPVAIAVHAAGKIVFTNPAGARLLGAATEAEIVGRSLAEIVHPDGLVEAGERIRRMLAGETGLYPVEDTYLKLDGTPIQVEVMATALPYQGQPAVQVIVTDITERKRAEARLRQLSQAVEQSPASIVITDLAGAIQYVNAGFSKTTGYTLEEALGQNPRLLQSGETPPEEYQRLWATITAGGEWRGEFHNRKKNGELYWESASISPVLDGAGRITHFLAVKDDITARKQHERQQAAMVAISTALRAAATRADMLPVILDQARALLDVEDVALVSVEPETGATWVELARGDWEASVGQRLPAGEGASGRVIATGQTYVSNTVRHDPHPRRLALAEGVVAAAIVPLIAQHQTVGALAVGSRHAIEPVQVRLLEAIADIAANALQRAALHEQTRRRADEFAALHATARELAAQQDLPWLLETIITRALDLIPATGALVALYDPTTDDLEIAVVRGLPIPPNMRLRLGEGAAGRVALTGQPLIVDDYQTWEGRSAQFGHIPLRALLCVPMLAGGVLIGALQIDDTEPAGRCFSEADANLLTLLASHAASAVYNARVLDEVRGRADELALVHDAGLALNSQLELRAMLEYLAKIIVQALHADVLGFFRYDAAAQTLKFELNLGHGAGARARLDDLAPRLEGENSFAAEVVRTRLPVRVSDLYADPRYVMVDPSFRSGLWVPVQYQGQLRGVLGILSRRLAAFTDRDERLLLLFANQTAVALQNAHLFAETQRRLRYVQALRQVDATIASSLELRPILNVLLDQTLSQLGVDAAAVLLLDARQQVLEHTASRGFRTRAIERARFPLGEGPIGPALQARRLVAIPDLAHSAEPVTRTDTLAEEAFAAYYAAPLIFRGQIKGVLEVFHRAPLRPDSEWLDYLETLAGQAALAVENVGLFDQLQRSNAELTQAYDATIAGWSRALDLRDRETEGHSQRVTDRTLALAHALDVEAEALVHIRRGALLHDIGKMGVPDAILFKPGPLTPEEWGVMRRHPELAYAMLSPIAFLRPALDIPYCHHERWDGAGYPRGLLGEQIPLAARIFAVVDVWDALRSDRPYRPAWPDDQIKQYLRAEAGRHFDPHVVAAFLELRDTP